MNLQETYNRIAYDWHRQHQSDNWWIDGTEKFISFLKPGALVLDVGCGGGTKSKYLAGRGLRVVGIDFSEKMIEIAKQELPSGTFLVMNLHNANGLDHVFDGIFLQAVLLHIPKQEVKTTLEKLVKKLQSGGYLYVAVKERKPKGIEEEVKVERDFGYRYARFFSYFTLDELNNLLISLGFEIHYRTIVASQRIRWIQMIGRRVE